MRRREYQMAVVLSVLLAGMWTSLASGDVHVKGTLSTGDTFDGKLLRDANQRMSVKGKKRTVNFMTVNIVECAIRVSDEKIPDDVEGVPLSGHGKFLLTKGYEFLSEAVFSCALSKTLRSGQDGELTLPLWAMEKRPPEKFTAGPQADAIKAIYTAARKKLPVRLGGKKTRIWRPRRYQLPPPAAIAAVLKQMNDWGQKMKQIAPKTHRIETTHFIIYSAWSRSDDAKLKSIYGKLYAGLCKQFDMPATHNLWIGKLPVFAFWEKKDFVSFSIKVCGAPPEMANQAGGFAGQRGSYQFVCLGPVMRQGRSKVQAQTWFYELLVHESTHAFLVRYISSGHVVNWLNEGIAEMLSATFVPKGGTSRKLKAAHAAVKQGKASQFLPMLTARNIPLDSVYYGASQSLARFLVARGKLKFIQLVYELKSGSGSEKALGKVYGLSHKGMLQQWARQVR